MQQSKAIELWVGLFVGLGLIALFFLAMKVSNLADLKIDDKSYVIKARFENVGSLKPKALVSMAGVQVGRVSAVTFDKDSYEAVVEMRIDPRFDTIPEDSSASILTQGLLGEQYVGVSAGGAPDYLKDGDEIELTQSALVLEEVISRFLFNKAESGAEKKSSENQEAGDKTDEDSQPAEEEAEGKADAEKEPEDRREATSQPAGPTLEPAPAPPASKPAPAAEPVSKAVHAPKAVAAPAKPVVKAPAKTPEKAHERGTPQPK
ncbi:outer membrane lipid asymmetry maintenance protein MlaD [Methylococcus sp. EFPC2]|uniref:outer membrane lipid asymmetry maintenance protein MlaD n=1 Tax=Methylococcus sp. EFPC2 TaxID=2812648 RepID=UPI001966E15E|nr:outer membrane lipid asymmetry maintenance protein MlaD [Methylococcus sp. EFPC2]